MHTYPSSRRRATMLGIALVASSALLLTGCGRGDDTPAAGGDSTTVDDKPATGTLEVWTQGADGAELPQMFEKFKADNPDVDINMTQIPEAEFASKMTAAITAGTVPDLIYSFTETQSSLIATGGFDPVPDGLVNKDDFFEVIWDNSVYDDVAYGVPWYAYSDMVIYRTDLAEAAGAEAPKDWDGLRTFGEKLKESGIEYPLALYAAYDSYTARQLLTFAAQNGGSFISDDLSEWTINSPENVEALEYWSGLIKDGLASPDGPAFLDTVSWSTTGKNAAIIDGGPWFVGWFDDANGEGWADEHLSLSTMPVGPDGDAATTVGGGSWFVPTDSENKDAAWKFARFMSEPESQVEWFKIFKNMPAVKSAWEDPALADDRLLATVEAGLETGITLPKVSTWSQVGTVIGEQMEKVVRGGLSAQDALDAAQQQAESIGMGN
ncbi:sugar ABC transporter substrate-binding protein [Microbacterium saperdae]|uniref:Carbohydrate ABC transporter substrate-binding protein (CUT1 family) n=1 Tax=Microbacterium saperdae TaxID=69368 RepID=A0A543BK88_9MICO|nr:extracellular solute-binding protein [Microbacterium saperdae]TQL85234.1 carbohydrate ABC transporter substrate-binding protein (CUT1 family) [Microbacterium saperdae]GGM55885.1 sugar ABC transporter substrate-binding protein [Microbacterium saperdae]